ncbi:fimbrial protein [Serratia liquefaciens]|uniref:fimbrial protein n=1 Tax=Serratia liquefaciens TaxID=614 RepID=UPI00165D0196|nr:fimbrial protein [Serratia liquefaciens]QNQ55437.1 type 1 fimbrial protein [Serratia liquefaciens]
MKLNKTMMASVLALGVSSSAFAADQGHGKVTFAGSIIDAPCSISPEAADQTVELGQISKVALVGEGKSTPRKFSIDLENCSFAEKDAKNKVSATFTGMAAENGRLAIGGTASGASIAILDAAGKAIKLGQQTTAQTLQNGNASLNFTAYLQGDGDKATITEGDFQAVADFTLAYN